MTSGSCLELARLAHAGEAHVREVALADAPRRRLAELGIRPGVGVSVVQRTSGGGVVIDAAGSRIALDGSTARAITVEWS